MPLVRIDLMVGTSPEYQKAIADGVHAALVQAIAIPADDRFQVITEHHFPFRVLKESLGWV